MIVQVKRMKGLSEMEKVNTSNGKFLIPEQNSERPPVVAHLNQEEYTKFLRFYLKHATSYSSLEERNEYALHKITKVISLRNGQMVIEYENGESFRFESHYA